MKINNIGILCLLVTFVFVLSQSISAQVSIGTSTSRKALIDLSDSLENEVKDIDLALQYEKAAKEATVRSEYALAEELLVKAKKIYEKQRDKDKVATMEREIAKLQELQKKTDQAIKNYESASKKSKAPYRKQINSNDAQRLINKENPQVQSDYIQSNITIFDKIDEPEEKAEANIQLADVNLQLQKSDEAIINLETALSETKSIEKKVDISKNIADIYAAEGKHDKAIDINKRLAKETQQVDNSKIKVKQLQNLSRAYLGKEDIESGLQSLVEAYLLAMEKGQTIDAKNSLEEIVKLYLGQKKTDKALESYADFTNRLETVIVADSSLMDAQMYNLISSKVKQLEKEKELNRELLEKKNTLNYSLIAIIVLVAIFLCVAIRALYSISKKNKRIALQSLRREMNPHFIFNSLNSVNQFIAQNNELEANKYLSSYSRLMRNMMENSNNDFIPLSVELEQLKEYLELEYMRFSDKFNYRIDIAESIDIDRVLIPNMLIQPYLENAIWHGLRYLEGKGLLSLSIVEKNSSIEICIEDNGIGIAKSKSLKTSNQQKHQSRGLNNTEERMKLLNDLYSTKITRTVIDKQENSCGVRVIISLPVITK